MPPALATAIHLPRLRATGHARGLPWLVLVVTVLLAPLLAVDVPPLLDYPNHLARMVVLANPGDPVLSHIYAPRWAIIPNLGIDLVLPWLLRLLPVHVAGRLMLGATLVLPVLGARAYHRALFPDVGRGWPLLSALVSCNALFLLGFVNFQLSLGLALLLATVWTRWRDSHPLPTTAACATGGVVLFFCHLGGLLFLMILLTAAEAERVFHRLRGREPTLHPALCGTALLTATLLPAALLYRASAFGDVKGSVQYLPWRDKLVGLLQPVLAYDPRLDALTALALLGLLGALLATRRLRVPLRTRLALAAILLLYALAPFAAKGGAWIDSRFALMAALLPFAGCAPCLASPVRRAVWFSLAALLLVRTAVVACVWGAHATDLRQLRDSIAAVPPGARVLVVRVSPQADPGFWAHAPLSRRVDGARPTESHDAALLLIERRAFWPLLFAIPSQQPVRVLPPFRDIAMPIGEPPDWRELLAPSPDADQLRAAPYLRDWRRRFDDVLVLDAEAVPDLSTLLPLDRLNREGFAALYHVRPADGQTDAHPPLVSWDGSRG